MDSKVQEGRKVVGTLQAKMEDRLNPSKSGKFHSRRVDHHHPLNMSDARKAKKPSPTFAELAGQTNINTSGSDDELEPKRETPAERVAREERTAHKETLKEDRRNNRIQHDRDRNAQRVDKWKNQSRYVD